MRILIVTEVTEKSTELAEAVERKKHAHIRESITHETAFGSPPDFLDNRFVYLVVSARARGLSIGVNMNPDKQCNFDCVYCEVNRTLPSGAEMLDVEVTSAALDQASWKLEQRSVRAPAAGLIYDTLYRLGEFVPAGSPIVRMLPPENIKLRFFVPERVLGSIAVGRRLLVSCDGCASPVAAQVDYVSAEAEYTPPVIYSDESRTKLVYMVEARPAPADAVRLHPGQPVQVRLQ